ncbi:hypothetical protein STENM327S_00992 [Streptomyces tendae]
MTTNAPRETLGARLTFGGADDRLKLLDALNEAGKLGRNARYLSLQRGQALRCLAGALLTLGGIPDVGAASSDAFNQPFLLELGVSVLHRHQSHADFFGVSPRAGQAVPGTERPCGDLVSDSACDLAGVGLPLQR